MSPGSGAPLFIVNGFLNATQCEALVAKLEREIDELRAQLEERDDAYLKLLKEYETLKGDVAGNAAMGGGDADKKMIAELMAQVR